MSPPVVISVRWRPPPGLPCSAVRSNLHDFDTAVLRPGWPLVADCSSTAWIWAGFSSLHGLRVVAAPAGAAANTVAATPSAHANAAARDVRVRVVVLMVGCPPARTPGVFGCPSPDL